MKKLLPLFDDAYYYVYINWHNPIRLKETTTFYSKINQDNVYLYKIIGKRGNTYRLLYIGMTETQYIQKRLFNKDHLVKQKLMQEENKGWVLFCSVGEYITKDDPKGFDWAHSHTKIIERMLIISHSEFPYLKNKKGVHWYSTAEAWIKVQNSGFMADKMHKIISYGPHYLPTS